MKILILQYLIPWLAVGLTLLFISLPSYANGEYFIRDSSGCAPVPCCQTCAYVSPCYTQIQIYSSAPYRHADSSGTEMPEYMWIDP